MKIINILILLGCFILTQSCSKEDPNLAPGIPGQISPENTEDGLLASSVTLTWSAVTDPEGDQIVYDVYLDKAASPSTIVSNEQAAIEYEATNLDLETTYYWKVVAKDDKGNTSESSTWSFTTSPFRSFTDARDGTVYRTIEIGTQTWMVDNLAFLPAINKVTEGSEETGKENLPFYYVYNYDGDNVSAAKETFTYKTYGVLYNWNAAQTVAPAGWHLPSDEEWKTLEKYLGTSQSVVDESGWRGTNAGKFKETGTEHWLEPNTGATNESHFTALPGGTRTGIGTFKTVRSYTTFWSSTENAVDTTEGWRRTFRYDDVDVLRNEFDKEFGFSVRCIKN